MSLEIPYLLFFLRILRIFAAMLTEFRFFGSKGHAAR